MSRRSDGLQAVALPADAEEFLDPLAVELARVHAVEPVEDFRKSLKPRGFGRHRAGSDSWSGDWIAGGGHWWTW